MLFLSPLNHLPPRDIYPPTTQAMLFENLPAASITTRLDGFQGVQVPHRVSVSLYTTPLFPLLYGTNNMFSALYDIDISVHHASRLATIQSTATVRRVQ
jgi:hypothetical protein